MYDEIQKTLYSLEKLSRVTTNVRCAKKTSRTEITHDLPGANATRKLKDFVSVQVPLFPRGKHRIGRSSGASQVVVDLTLPPRRHAIFIFKEMNETVGHLKRHKCSIVKRASEGLGMQTISCFLKRRRGVSSDCIAAFVIPFSGNKKLNKTPIFKIRDRLEP